MTLAPNVTSRQIITASQTDMHSEQELIRDPVSDAPFIIVIWSEMRIYNAMAAMSRPKDCLKFAECNVGTRFEVTPDKVVELGIFHFLVQLRIRLVAREIAQVDRRLCISCPVIGQGISSHAGLYYQKWA